MNCTNHDFSTAVHNLAVSRAKLEAACEAGIDDDAAVSAHDEALDRFGAAPSLTVADIKAKIAEYDRMRPQPEGEFVFDPFGRLTDGIIADIKRLIAA